MKNKVFCFTTGCMFGSFLIWGARERPFSSGLSAWELTPPIPQPQMRRLWVTNLCIRLTVKHGYRMVRFFQRFESSISISMSLRPGIAIIAFRMQHFLKLELLIQKVTSTGRCRRSFGYSLCKVGFPMWKYVLMNVFPEKIDVIGS